ncbi:cupin domain-containing protein [Anaerocolumna sp. AGMB13020]|uniref:cupin domain-containing protein n=1 Tax=Anaerocolumna sp. AGMB13020 TaxID=3081750 RepID=UPI0029554CE7|nr:cupin domain-containing protein [Anaerocolumna sp. AGMB13020]WOO38004.1 cupin domain-containing protein [Anaerocolumna sp. AGMB13020]
MEKINVYEKLGTFNDFWSPKIIGEMNESYVKLVKLKGEFVWHLHENEDEMFMVIKGKMVIKLRTEDIVLNQGELFIIPRGVEHMPVAEDEVHVMLIEPKTTLNTGNIKNERTVENLEII